MYSFSFRNPTQIHFGEGMTSMLATELKNAQIKQVLLIAGTGSIKDNGVYTEVTDVLKSNGVDWIEGWGVQPNPTLAKVQELIALAKAENVQAIVAVGGGSVIDTAKAVAAGFYLKDVWNAFTHTETITKTLPIYTVLTLSATGSEMNGNAVITNEAEHKKWAISSPLLYPKVSIIDPTHQISLSFRQTVNGALDAMAHILEYYFVDILPETTLAINDALLKTIVVSTDRLQQDKEDLNARSNLAWSSTLALNGLSGLGLKGGDWACHQIEHSLSAFNPKIAHGEGLGVIFPTWIEYMCEKDPSRFMRWTRNNWFEDIPCKGVKRLREKIESWGSAGCLRDLGIQESDLPKIVDNIMQFPTIGAISKFTRQEVEALLMLAW